MIINYVLMGKFVITKTANGSFLFNLKREMAKSF
jgi:uncharacterized protein YegP (UPF0339 family)